VLLVGSTGLVGSEILGLLTEDHGVSEVRKLVRRPADRPSLIEKVAECVVDFEALDGDPALFQVDQVFCALGTTIKQAGSQVAFRRVDFGYPLTVARLAREAGARQFLLVSAVGANSRSRIFYNRVKGELEEEICRLGYPSVTIARPSLLLGERKERRGGEEMAKILGLLMPARWRPVRAVQVASALVHAARGGPVGIRILENRELRSQ
jgi:uncharacterized protein YbjT (DUF2867 family)